jgi:hypothetical protein
VLQKRDVLQEREKEIKAYHNKVNTTIKDNKIQEIPSQTNMRKFYPKGKKFRKLSQSNPT